MFSCDKKDGASDTQLDIARWVLLVGQKIFHPNFQNVQGCGEAAEDAAAPERADLRAQRGERRGRAARHRARGAAAGAPRAAGGQGAQAGQLPRMGDIPGGCTIRGVNRNFAKAFISFRNFC